jgi:predicted ester cyclase
MSTEVNKAVVRRFYEECNKGKEAAMTAMEELYAAPSYVWHGPGVFPDLDRTGMKQMMPAFFTAFPDLHYTVEDLIAEGDKVVSRFTARATHQGEFMGIPATGKVVTYTGIYISRFAGGKCVEDWFSGDMLGLFQQLGAIPQMAQTGA